MKFELIIMMEIYHQSNNLRSPPLVPRAIHAESDESSPKSSLRGSQRFRHTARQRKLGVLGKLMSQVKEDCQKIGSTDIGRLLNAHVLSEADFPHVKSTPPRH